MKDGKRKALIIIPWVLTGCLLLCSAGLVVLYKTGALYSAMVDYSVEGEVTPNAEKLCNAILSNDSLTFVEKVRMMKFNQYFVDNKYIECDRVCGKILSLTIENDASLIEAGISGTYTTDGNYLSFATNRDRKNSLAHELHHCMQNEALSYEEYGWFIEGYTSLITYEYFDETEVGVYMLPYFVRGLCEIVGSDVIFQTDAKGDIDILKKALKDKGVPQKTVEEAFTIFYELWTSESCGETVTNKQKVKAIKILEEMYDYANFLSEDITESFYKSAQALVSEYEDEPIYYFNSVIKSSFGSASSSTGNSDEFYDDGPLLYRDMLIMLYEDVESGLYD